MNEWGDQQYKIISVVLLIYFYIVESTVLVTTTVELFSIFITLYSIRLQKMLVLLKNIKLKNGIL